jgi:predicted cobalt transporter CbtA
MSKNLFLFIASLICTIAIALMLRGYFDCSDAGGDYVRGILWMECVK